MTTSTSTPSTAADPRPMLRRAARQAVTVIGAIPPAGFDGPTPCPEFDVRTLAGHVLTVLRRVTTVAAGGEALSVPRVVVGVADGDVAAVAASDAEHLAEVWSDAAVLDRVLTLPFGTMPGRAAALAYTQELTVHAWDLAVSLGRTDLLDDALAQVTNGPAHTFVPAEPRGGPVPFGPVVGVPAGAPAYDQLVGWLGRDPSWRPAG